MPLDAELTPREMRHWMGRIDRALSSLDVKVDSLPFLRADVYAADREAVMTAVRSNREYVDGEIKTVDLKVENVARSFSRFKAALWSAAASLAVLGSGAFALIHK